MIIYFEIHSWSHCIGVILRAWADAVRADIEAAHEYYIVGIHDRQTRTDIHGILLNLRLSVGLGGQAFMWESDVVEMVKLMRQLGQYGVFSLHAESFLGRSQDDVDRTSHPVIAPGEVYAAACMPERSLKRPMRGIVNLSSRMPTSWPEIALEASAFVVSSSLHDGSTIRDAAMATAVMTTFSP